jgi:Dolichyl-phosphate-mannose-protein mannosyltransferase
MTRISASGNWPDRLADTGFARKVFFATLAVTLLFRWVLAIRLPITGDEAYFFYWGQHPDWGFYDHPPMVGWWLSLLADISKQPWVLRLPALLAPVIIAWIAYGLLRRSNQALAFNAASLMLLAPLNSWNVAVTTDIPLMIFSFAAVAFYLRAQRTGHWLDFWLCGSMLAGGLLSKYFAGMLALALTGHALWRPSRPKLIGLAWVVIGSLPAAVIQIAWNAQNCWPNLMFNLVNRNVQAGWTWRAPLLYAVSLAYVLTPWVFWRLIAGWRSTSMNERADPLVTARIDRPAASRADRWITPWADRSVRALSWIVALPLALFLLLSAVKTIGLHWLASFVAPAILLYAFVANRKQFGRALAWSIGLAGIHYLVIIGFALVPLEKMKAWSGYPGLVVTLAPDAVRDALEPYRGRFVLASDGYSAAVTMGFNLHEYVLVFGPGSSHARQDDLLTDFRKLDGRDLLIIRKDPDRNFDDTPYFDRIERRVVDVRGAPFHLTEGYGFHYERYRDTVLEEVRRRFYAVPNWLPKGPCYLCERYFADRACHR